MSGRPPNRPAMITRRRRRKKSVEVGVIPFSVLVSGKPSMEQRDTWLALQSEVSRACHCKEFDPRHVLREGDDWLARRRDWIRDLFADDPRVED